MALQEAKAAALVALSKRRSDLLANSRACAMLVVFSTQHSNAAPTERLIHQRTANVSASRCAEASSTRIIHVWNATADARVVNHATALRNC